MKMKNILSLIILTCSVVLSTGATIGNLNATSTLTDGIGNGWINATRFQATNTLVLTQMTARVVGITGNYKCAIYTDSNSLPAKLLGSTLQITNPASGQYNFPLISTVTITNGQYYWLAVWSGTSTAGAYYVSGGSLRWGFYAYGVWPTNFVSTAGSSATYCIYASGNVPITNAPVLVTNAPVLAPSIALTWSNVDFRTNISTDILGNTNLATTNWYLITNVISAASNYLVLPRDRPMEFFVVRNKKMVGTNTVYLTYQNLTTINLAWDYSPDSSAIGYKIYYGVQSGVYTNSILAGKVSVLAVGGLTTNINYYFAATAYDSNNVESVFSNEAVGYIPSGGITATCIKFLK